MIVTVNEKQTEGKVKYPCLMKSKKGNIVLMYCYAVGTLLSEPKDISVLKGQCYDSWNMDYFTPFKGSITLENDY